MQTTRRNLLLSVLMLGSAATAVVLTPKVVKIDPSQRVDYETVIPDQFGTWVKLPANQGGIVNPQTEEALARLYSQIVSRVYRDSITGKTIMLSLAYGEEQNKQSQVHLPEVCYPAQGFQMRSARNELLTTPVGEIPVKRLEATLGARNEPITYWIRTGDKLVRGGLEQKLATIQAGFAGKVSDGLLFRVSSIDSNAQGAYELQDRFLRDFLPSVKPNALHLLLGTKVIPQ
jgi:EpsI family protein